MTETDRDILRHAILQTLADRGDSGLPAVTLGYYCEDRGFLLSATTLSAELECLCDKGLVVARSSALSAGFRRYALSDSGRAYLRSQHRL